MSAARTVVVGLIGRGICASESPAIHEGEAADLGLALAYLPIDFDELELADEALSATLDFVAGIGFAGVNLTHPFKQQVIALLDEVEETAAALGAVNCVRFENGRKIGFNSDWIGFSWLLESELAGARFDRVAQFGAGGAGSATAFALLHHGTRELRLFDTQRSRCEELSERLRRAFPRAGISVCSQPETTLEGCDGVVQTTPIGMGAHPGMPFDPGLLREGQWLADVIYFPRESELVLAARAKGLKSVGGEAMVVGQAAAPFHRWTGLKPDRARMMRRLRERFNAASAITGEA